ncbi:hypothetical protein B7767_32715, partial [Streptomyces sp. 13-12-16]
MRAPGAMCRAADRIGLPCSGSHVRPSSGGVPLAHAAAVPPAPPRTAASPAAGPHGPRAHSVGRTTR